MNLVRGKISAITQVYNDHTVTVEVLPDDDDDGYTVDLIINDVIPLRVHDEVVIDTITFSLFVFYSSIKSTARFGRE